VRLLAEVGDQVAGLLGGPFPGWMQSDAEDADAPGGVLYHGQDMGLGAVEQACGARLLDLAWAACRVGIIAE
jgi:hypothetical protein